MSLIDLKDSLFKPFCSYAKVKINFNREVCNYIPRLLKSIFQLLPESLSQNLFLFKLVTRNIVNNLQKKSFDKPLKHIIQHIVCP